MKEQPDPNPPAGGGESYDTSETTTGELEEELTPSGPESPHAFTQRRMRELKNEKEKSGG